MSLKSSHALKALVGLALVGMVLAGCRSVGRALDTRPNAGPCPTAAALYEASRVVELDGNGELYGNIAWTGEIIDVRLFCRYVDEDPLLAEIEIDFAFGKGPQATGNAHQFNYFVAVTRRNRSVLEKEIFPVTFEIPPGELVTGKRELIGRVVIPRYDQSISGANFEILVGFDLTPEQLAFNRAGKRFRLDAAEGLQ